MPGLSDKQLAFVEHYLVDCNANDAARKSGYSGKNAADQLMKNREITREISLRMKTRSERMELKADTILQELSNIAFLNLQDFLHPDGSYKDVHELSREAAGCIVQAHYRFDKKTGQRIVTGYTFWDKQWAIDLCMRHLGLLNDKLNIQHDTSENFLAMLLERARKPKESNIIDAESVKLKLGSATPTKKEEN